MVRFYGLTENHVLNMPIRRFWSACGHVDRLQAAEALNTLDLMLAGNAMGSGDTAKEYREMLRERLGTPTWREKPRSSKGDILALMSE